MGIKTGLFKWDIKDIAKALKIKETDVRLYFLRCFSPISSEE